MSVRTRPRQSRQYVHALPQCAESCRTVRAFTSVEMGHKRPRAAATKPRPKDRRRAPLRCASLPELVKVRRYGGWSCAARVHRLGGRRGGLAAGSESAAAATDAANRVLIDPNRGRPKLARAKIGAFLQALQEYGWTDGRNVRIEYRWGAGDANRVHALAGELAASTPDVILAGGGGATLGPLQQATQELSVPIVFVLVTDPVGSGYVAELGAARWQYHRVHDARVCYERKIAGTTKADCAGRNASNCSPRSHRGKRGRPIRRTPGCSVYTRGER